MSKLIFALRNALAHRELIAAAIMLGAGICFVPLQHFMPLSRYQHYSFALFIFAGGLLGQPIVSWRRIGIWGRLSMLSACFYVVCCAYFFYSNPWLGNPDLATERQLIYRQQFVAFLAMALFPVSYCWIRFACQPSAPAPAAGKEREQR